MDGFIASQKRYLATCLRISRTPEVDKLDSKRMRVDAMTDNGKVSFAEECKQIGTKGGKKNAKREA